MIIPSLHLSLPLLTNPSDVLLYMLRHYILTPSNIYENYYNYEFTCSKRLAAYHDNPDELVSVIENDLIEYISRIFPNKEGYHSTADVSTEFIDDRRYNLIFSIMVTDKFGNKYSAGANVNTTEYKVGTVIFNDMEVYDMGQYRINPFTGKLDIVSDTEHDEGSEIVVGVPTDGTFTDGQVDITPDTLIADAIDLLNEYIKAMIDGDEHVKLGSSNEGDIEADGKIALETTLPITDAIYRLNSYLKSLSVGDDQLAIGSPSDGSFDDGYFKFTPSTKISDAIDNFNEILPYLLPATPDPLDSELLYSATFNSGFIAQSNIIGNLTAGSNFSKIINTVNVTATTKNSTRFDKADIGSLKVLAEDSSVLDSISLADNFNEAERDGSQSYPPVTSTGGLITILSVEWFNDFPAYQKGSARLNLNGLLQVGYNYFKLIHEISDTESQETNPQIIFVDNGSGITINSFTATITESDIRYLSGIKFITENNSISISTDVDGLFDKTYISNPVTVSGGGISNTQIPWNDPASGNHADPPNFDDNWTISKNITPSNHLVSDNLALTLEASNIFHNASRSYTIDALCLFFPTPSTDLVEEFEDENYRLPLNIIDNNTIDPLTGNWDSSIPLVNGNAQVYNNKLRYPKIDFSTVSVPSQNGGTDYSVFSGNQVYSRAFKTSSPVSNGSIKILGISFGDIGTNCKIEFRVPGVTGWLDLGSYFSVSTFTGVDGDGNLVDYNTISGGIILNWTIGTFSTLDSNNTYVLKVTLMNDTVEISHISEEG